MRYYIESVWNVHRGLEVIRMFKRGDIKHFAVFYDREKAEKILELLNEDSI